MNDDRWTPEAFCEYYAFLKQVGNRLISKPSIQMNDLDDCVQAVLMQVYKKKKRLNDHPNLKGWLVVAFKKELASNRRSEIKKGKWIRQSLDDSHSDALQKVSTSMSLNPEFFYVDQYPERLEKIKQLIGKENTELLMEAYVEGLPTSVVAARRGISEGALKMRIHRLKEKIRRYPELFFSFLIFELLLHK